MWTIESDFIIYLKSNKTYLGKSLGKVSWRKYSLCYRRGWQFFYGDNQLSDASFVLQQEQNS